MCSKIIVHDLSKSYAMYDTPVDRLKEAVFRNGKVRHTDFLALNHISFEVGKGEILGIVGSNGAGKSTLLKIITGVLTPTDGNVRTDGKISSLLELGTGFHPEYTGIENIFFYGTLMGLSHKQVKSHLDAIVSFAEIGDYIYQPVKTYSSGMFARLAFACAIHVEPDILIVDEILSVGDIRFQAKCFNKFKSFKERGVTILYVGHDVSMMKTFCDRVIWLNHGTLIMDGSPSEVVAKYVEYMYLDDTDEFTSYKKYHSLSDGQIQKNVFDSAEPAAQKNAASGRFELSADEACSKPELFADALAHWGTHTGMVRKVFLKNKDGQEVNHFTPEETITIGFEFQAEKVEFAVLSAAISIKNKEGTDLIVKTSYDEGISLKGQNGKMYGIAFEMKTYLAVGEYYLVVALENRTEITPMYYEYIDGALFFKVFTDKKIYGKVDVPVKIEIKEVR